MADLNALVQEALAGLIAPGESAGKTALYGDINRTAADTGRQALESQFGRGLGISTISANLLGEIERARADAVAKAQLSALGQAATVAQSDLNRGQAASQFGQQLGLQKKALSQQRSIANQNLLAQGLGLGVGGLAQVAGKTFGPEIVGGLRRLAGLGDTGYGSGAQGGLDALARGGQIVENAPTDLAARFGALTEAAEPQFSLGDLSGLGSGGGGFDLGSVGLDTSFALPDLADLSWLTLPDTSFSLLAF